MISLAGRDIAHAWGKFVFTGLGLGLLLGVTLVMAGVYRGMVDDGKALLEQCVASMEAALGHEHPDIRFYREQLQQLRQQLESTITSLMLVNCVCHADVCAMQLGVLSFI